MLFFSYLACQPLAYARKLLILAALIACGRLALAQSPAPSPAAEGGSPPISSGVSPSPAPGVPGTLSPAAGSPPAPIAAGGASSATPAVSGPALTLADVVRIALGNNSGLVAAKQRLQMAQELIAQVNAQGRPQISAYAQDTDTSYATFAPGLVLPYISPLTVPSSTIPTVVDAAGNFPTAFVGSESSSISATPGVSTSTTAPMAPASPTAPAGTAPASPTAPAGTAAPSAGGMGASGSPSVYPPILIGYVTQPPGSESGQLSVTSGLGSRTKSDGLDRSDESDGLSADSRPAASQEAADEAMATGQAPEQQPATPAENGNAAAGPVAAAPSTPTARSNNYGARVSVAQYLDLYRLLPAARGAEESVRDFYALDIQRLQNETALVAKNLFFNLLYAQAQVDTAQQQVNYAQEDVRITQSRLAQGIDSNFDVLTAQTALSTAQQQLTAAQDQRDLAQATLAYLLGTDLDTPLLLAPPSLPSLDQAVDVSQATATALVNRPEVRQAAANIQEAQRLVKLARAGLLPTFGLVGTGVEDNSATSSIPQGYAEISAELALPLDDGGATRSRVRSAQVDVQAQNLALLQLQQNMRLEVREAAVNIKNAQAQMASAQTGVDSAQEALRLARERFQAGLGTFLDVLNALAQLAATRTNLSTAQYDYQTSLAQMVRAMGDR